jgi:hypothetical protein
MDKEDITDKINRIFERKNFVEDECCVAYLMVQMRKLLDHVYKQKSEKQNKSTLLRFYCDWVVHTQKDNLSGMKEVFERIDSLVIKVKLSHEEYDTILDFIRMPELRVEMLTFLRAQNLSTDFCKNDISWKAFVLTLGEILTGQKIVNPSSSIKSIEISSFSDGAMVDIYLTNGHSMSVGMGVDVV